MTEIGNWGDGWPNTDKFVTKTVTEEEIAGFIRDNVWEDDDACLKDASDCMAAHPLHYGHSMDGKVLTVYADVDRFARMLADWFNSR